MELIRHIRACNNARLPGGRMPVLIGAETVGWVQPGTAEAAAAAGVRLDPCGLHVDPAALAGLVRTLSGRGLFRWRGEAFDVRAEPDGAVLAQIDRGALPAFGIRALGVHVNGLVGERLWVARRARDKPLDPGKLDHIVAGGIAAGDTPASTVIKEAAEEAGLPADLAAGALLVGRVDYAMERDEGLRRDTLYCYDLEMPEHLHPVPADGEVEAFELWPLTRVLDAVRDTDDFKFNVNLVLIDLFLRRGLVGGAEAERLAAALRQPSGGAEAIGMSRSRDSAPD